MTLMFQNHNYIYHFKNRGVQIYLMFSCYTLTTTLPILAPLKRAIKASKMESKPSNTNSLYCSFPYKKKDEFDELVHKETQHSIIPTSWIHCVICLKASGHWSNQRVQINPLTVNCFHKIIDVTGRTTVVMIIHVLISK